MAARRCVVHGNFPTYHEYYKCPICGEQTSFMNNEEPDEYYAEKIAVAREHDKVAAAESPLIPCVSSEVRVRSDDGGLWLHVWDLYAHGIRDKLKPHDLVQVGKQTFEVIEYVETIRQYLVRPFSTTLSDYDLKRLASGS